MTETDKNALLFYTAYEDFYAMAADGFTCL